MKINKKVFFIVSITVLVMAIVPMFTIAAQQFLNKEKGGWIVTSPPVAEVNPNDENREMLLDPYASSGQKLFGDYEKNFCLGYLDNFKFESITDKKDTAELKRITRKNELIQEYKAYVGKLYNQVMTIKEYESHYEHLMNLFSKMLELEPEKTQQEQLVIDINRLLILAKENLYYSEIHGEEYVKERKIDVSELKQLITGLTSLQEKYNDKKISFEEYRNEYVGYTEKVSGASPYLSIN